MEQGSRIVKLLMLLVGVVIAVERVLALINSDDNLSYIRDVGTMVVADRRMDYYVPYLQDKRVALVVNKTSVVDDDVHLCDALMARGVNVVKIFAPEHGFRANADAGEHVSDDIDPVSGCRIVSLYGKNKKPTSDQLRDVDIVVYDLQDVGVRFYTYISTLHYVMEACAENKKTLVVLDRPNPNGDYVDGPVLDLSCRSFVGMDMIPVVYGLTPGELASMINGEGWLAGGVHCDLKVVPILHYRHDHVVEIATPPSPNLRSLHAIRLYPSLCFFEATSVSVGRGTESPFEVIGSPDVSVYDYKFTPVSSEGAKNPLHQDMVCCGMDLRDVDAPSNLSLHYFLEFHKLLGDKFWTNPSFFDLLAGNKILRQQINSGMTEDQIRATWQPELDKYKHIREKYLIYDKPHPVQDQSLTLEDCMHDVRVDSLMKNMTLDDKISQLLWVTLNGNPTSKDIQWVCDNVTNYNVGGVLLLQNSLYEVPSIVEHISDCSKYPLLFAIDAENGLGMKFSDVVKYPKNMTLGAVSDEEAMYKTGVLIGQQLKSCGLNVDFAPVVDVNTNPNNPIIGMRSFGEVPEHVGAYGSALARGIQSQGCIAVAKHFPGHGDTDTDSHLALPSVSHSSDRLEEVELRPFRDMIDSGVMGVMSAHLIVPSLDSTGRPASMSKSMLFDLLRNKMHFNGLIISDAMNMKGAQIAAGGMSQEALAIVAGNDVAEFCMNVPNAINEIKRMIDQGALSLVDIDDKVRRVLAAKLWCGLDKKRFIGNSSVVSNSIEAELWIKHLYERSITVLDTLNISLNGDNVLLGKWIDYDKHAVHESSVDMKWVFADASSLAQCVSMVNSYPNNVRVSIVYAGNPYRLKALKSLKRECGLVIAYEHNDVSCKALLDFVNKGGVASGRLPVSVLDYKAGFSNVVTRKIKKGL